MSYPGKQCQLYDISFLAAPGCNPCGNGTGTLPEGDSGDPGSYSGQPGDRDICTWSYVYLLFRKMSSEQFLYRKRCEPGSLYTSVPLEIFCGGRDKARANICLSTKMREVPIFLTPKICCMVDHLPDLVDAGVDSLKIEGRMKTALYVATVARTYRKALDDLEKGREVYEQNLSVV